jgi:hypothetical protein
MRSRRAAAALRIAAGLSAVVLIVNAVCATEFRTQDPLKAFVYGEYAVGSDYFIHGNDNTIIFRCLLTKAQRPFEGVALSEISIWGNPTGPWEVFRRSSDGTFVYVETRHFDDTSCLESCRSKDYLASGQCTWSHGWPRQ